MKTETINAVEMTRKIRDTQAALYWKDKAEYLKRMKEAAEQLRNLLSQQRAHRS